MSLGAPSLAAPAAPSPPGGALATLGEGPSSPTSRLTLHRTGLPALIEREHGRRRRTLLAWGLAIGALGVGSAALGLLLRPRPVPLDARFRSSPVTQGDVVREVRATGHVEAVSTVAVGAEISGRIATVEVDYNDRVQAGQVLARFDRSALAAQQAQVEATRAAAAATVAQARFDLEQSQRNLQRAEQLHASKAQSDAEHDLAGNATAVATARLHAAQAQLEAQQAAAALARTNLDHAVIRSPIDGVVISRNVDPGQTVASVLQTPVLFSVAEDLRRMRVVAAVDEADMGEVAVGQRATFTVNAWPDRTFEGAVTEVRNSPVMVQDVVTYGTVGEVSNPDFALRPGMTASVRIRTGSASRVPRLPNAALHFTPPGEQRQGSDPEVWILDGPRLSRRAVKVGITDGEQSALLGGDLSPSARVLTELTPAGRKAYGADHH